MMNKHRKIIWVLFFIVFGLFLILALCISVSYHRVLKKNRIVNENIPTFFFHGGGSNYHAEDHMVEAAKKAGVTNSIIVAFVDFKGNVSLKGEIPKNAKNPIVKVDYTDNKQLVFDKYGEFATNVVKTVYKAYHFKQMNMVGHSVGNMSIIYYLLQNSKSKDMPKLNKQVDIAGHFGGLDFKSMPLDIRQPSGLSINSEGMPNKMNASYKQMTVLRSLYPEKEIAVLNIIGDIGDQTDGTVPNVSSLSLRYLVADRAKSYQEVKITGKNAQHSKLHNNKQVDQLLIKFLWYK